ncbi:hypothetical protein ABZ820_41470, partial [Streptomyces diacarni]
KIDPFGTGHLELSHQDTRYAVSLIEAVRDAIRNRPAVRAEGRRSAPRAAGAHRASGEVRPVRQPLGRSARRAVAVGALGRPGVP